MCLMVYVASNSVLPTSSWDHANPGFYVADLSERDEPVRRQFSKAFVYYTGSHEGCGCGFQYGDFAGREQQAMADNRESRRRLADFLQFALQHQPAIEVFACWDGDQGASRNSAGRIRPRDLIGTRTFFRERELLEVSEIDAADCIGY